MVQKLLGALLIIGLLWVPPSEAASQGRSDFGWALVVEENAVLVDLRERKAFDEGHVAGAINIPLSGIVVDGIKSDELETRFYVMYGGPDFHVSQVTALLNKYGFRNSFYAGTYEAMMGTDPLRRPRP